MALIISNLQLLASVKFGGMAVCLNKLNWHKGEMGSMRKVGLQHELKLLRDWIAVREIFAAKNGIALVLHNLSLIVHFISF